MGAQLTQSTCGRTQLITLNRAEKRNALTVEMVDGLRSAIDRAADDADVSAVIINGAGPDFCAGMDIARATDQRDGPAFAQQFGVALVNLLDTIERIDTPVIAAVHGAALAGGAALVTTCDLAVAESAASLGYPGIRRGLVAPLVMPSLVRAVGERRARALLITGDTIDGGEAYRIGLITHLAENQTAIDLAMKLADQLAELPPDAIAQVKRSLLTLRRVTIDGHPDHRPDGLARIHRFVTASDRL